MKVYVASPLAFASIAREYANRVRMTETMTVCSTWHDVVTEVVDPTDEGTRRSVLIDNLSDLNQADCALAIMSKGTPRAAHAEIGYALALGKPVIWLVGPNGEGESIFTAHALVTICRRHDEVLPALYRVAEDGVDGQSCRRVRTPSYPAANAFTLAGDIAAMQPRKMAR